MTARIAIRVAAAVVALGAAVVVWRVSALPPAPAALPPKVAGDVRVAYQDRKSVV